MKHNVLLVGLPYLAIAIVLDLLQIMIEAIFSWIGALSGTLGGTLAGTVVGSKICSVVPSLLSTSCNGIFLLIGGFVGSLLDPILAPAITPVMVILGTIANIAISISIGTGFIIMLAATSGLFDISIVMPFYIAKVIPFSDVAPLWSVMVGRLILKKTLKKVAPAAIKSAMVGAIKNIEGGPEAMAAGAVMEAIRSGERGFREGEVPGAKQAVSEVKEKNYVAYYKQTPKRPVDIFDPKNVRVDLTDDLHLSDNT